MANIESGGNILEVGAEHKSGRVTLRPNDANGWFNFGLLSGLLTAVAANGTLFSLRNTSGSNLLILRAVRIKFVTTTAFTAAQELAWQLFLARNFTNPDTGGTAINLTGNNNKIRTSMNTLSAAEMRMATTGALGAGTRTLDVQALACTGGFSAAQGATIGADDLLQQSAGDYPIVLAQNEGIVLTNTILMGAAGVGRLHVNFEMAEVAAY